jgi:hypothetical protein
MLRQLALPFALAFALTQAANASYVNDTCGTADQITLSSSCWGIIHGNQVSDADPVDHFRATLDIGHEARIRIRFDHPDGNIDVRLWNSDCTVLLASSASTTDDELVTWINTGQTAVEVVCEVYLNGTGNVDFRIERCQKLVACNGPDDWEQNNDSCATPTVLPYVQYTYKNDRTIQVADDDYYEITIPAYGRLLLEIGTGSGPGDVDAALYEAACGALLQTSATMGVEILTLDNLTTTPRTVVVHVYLVGSEPCAIYSMLISGKAGSNFCTSSQNSTGGTPQISAWGSASVSTGGISLSACSLPFKVPGIFLYGPNPGSVPFGNGTLCVSGAIVRSPVFQSFKSCTSWQLNYANQSSSIHPIVAGATYDFQLWYRDVAAGGAGFNLTDAYRLAFYP